MPIYEYECGGGCGSFATTQPMSRSAQPAPCPTCGDEAPRVLSATAVRHGRGRRKRGRPEPNLVTQRNRDREPAAPRPVAAQGRPWMLGH